MLSVKHWGTFDVANFGDLLFPLILENQLRARLGDVSIELFSPHGGTFAFPDRQQAVNRVVRRGDPAFYAGVASAVPIVLGGGDIVRCDDIALANIYGLSQEEAQRQRLFRIFIQELGDLARFVPVSLNCVGIPHEFAVQEHASVAAFLRHVQYISVRDNCSKGRLEQVGVDKEIHVVPDTGLLVSSVLPRAALQADIDRLKDAGSFPRTGKVLAVQLNFAAADIEEQFAMALSQVAGKFLDLNLVFVPIGACHGDVEAHARIVRRLGRNAFHIDQALSVREIAAVIGSSDYFIGSSLHGALAASSYGVDSLILALPPYSASKLHEYSVMLKREECLVSSVSDLAVKLRKLVDRQYPSDEQNLSALQQKIASHFDRLAHDIQNRAADTNIAAGKVVVRSTQTPTASTSLPDSAGGAPAVSAIIPLYNGRDYLRQAVQSVAAQTCLPAELIVVDDGSTDGGITTIQDLALPFPLIIMQQDNGGQAQARNRAAALATGDYLAFLDQDDLWYPYHLERLLEPCREQPGIGWTYGNLDHIDQFGNTIVLGCLDHFSQDHHKSSLHSFLSTDAFIVPSAVLIRTDAFIKVGGFDERLSGFEDDDLFLRLFLGGHRHKYIPDSLSQWRIHSQSCSYGARMEKSRRIYAEKLIAAFPDDPELRSWWVRDTIAPRFFHEAIHRYYRELTERNFERCQIAYEDMRRYGSLMSLPSNLRLRLRFMRFPRLFSVLSKRIRAERGTGRAHADQVGRRYASNPMSVLRNHGRPANHQS